MRESPVQAAGGGARPPADEGRALSAPWHRAGRLTALLCVLVFGQAALALDGVRLRVAGDDAALRDALRAASAVIAAASEPGADGQALVGAAISDYRNLVETLYANGYYGGVVHIRIDGREAADIPLLDVPKRIGEIVLNVDPGPPYRFGEVRIGPAPRGVRVPVPRPGERARSPRVRQAVQANVAAWRAAGYAKATPVRQRAVADHAARTLSVGVAIDPGRRLRFGRLLLTGPSAVRASRIRRIAGFPAGQWFAPDALDVVATRLRRTGAFSSVTLTEAAVPGPGDALDVALQVVDEKPRRFGFGAELSSNEGIRLSGFWLHRNLFGGAERFRVEADAANIGGQTGGPDYSTGMRLEIPASFGPDSKAFLLASYKHLDEPDFQSDQVSIGGGGAWTLSPALTAEIGVTLSYSETQDALGARTVTLLSFPSRIVHDRRDDPLNPASGTYLAAEFAPFTRLDGSAAGIRSLLDGRAYRGIGETDGFVLAGRVQIGSVTGAALGDVHPDFLFHSGGSNTVRGQPYQSLGVDLGGGASTGGRSFLALSAELRARITKRIGAVAFVDAGYVGAESFYDGSGAWHSGAGIGLRYQTPVGPIRFDVAAPVSGDTGSGTQFYIGIGQAF